MQFNSIEFLLFSIIVVSLYFIAPRKTRVYILLVASYFFYMCWNAKYSILIGTSTVVTYVSAILFKELDRYKNRKKLKRIVMIGCIVANLSLLFLFKYGNFGIETINRVLLTLRIRPLSYRFNFLLPVGISFYTFQALGYMIDVYRGDVEVERNFARYALFVSFFPQLVAGPIERSKNFLSQLRDIEKIEVWNLERVSKGLILVLWGLFMKMVIADRSAIFVDAVFQKFRLYGSTELIIAIVLFAIELYCDFGGYSMIAIGMARIMGFDLMENFRAPYLAMSIRDFWSRWHISLSTWFRDYLYIPLGGNRKGILRKYINIMIVFVVSGLWHGANLTFAIWGFVNGAYQVVGDMTKTLRNKIVDKFKIETDCFSHHLYKGFVTFSLWSFSLIFFRSASIRSALSYIKRILLKVDPWVLFNGDIYKIGLAQVEVNILLVAIIILIIVDVIRVKKDMTLDRYLFTQNLWFRWAIIIGLIVVILTFGEYGPYFDPKQFIYFQF